MNLRQPRVTLKLATHLVLALLIAVSMQALVFPVIGLQVMLWQQLTLSAVLITVSRLWRSWSPRPNSAAAPGDPGGEG